MLKRKSVVGFERSGRIEVMHYSDASVEILDGRPVKITGTLGADPEVVTVRPVPVKNRDFALRMLTAAGSGNFCAVEFS